MIRTLLPAILLGFLALPALAAEPADAPEPGREATIHLLDGNMIECIVVGFADGEFRIKQADEEYSVPIDKVGRITFGKAVGESVRNPFAPAATPPTTPPETPKTPEKGPRPVEDMIRSLDTRQLVQRLARWTGRYRNARSLKRTEVGVRRMLAEEPKRGRLDRNLRLLLVLLKTADGEMETAKHTLDELKRIYADDELLQEVRVGKLATMIERIKQSDRRPRRRLPRRERERDRDAENARPGPPPE